jgi:hypothetical protein
MAPSMPISAPAVGRLPLYQAISSEAVRPVVQPLAYRPAVVRLPGIALRVPKAAAEALQFHLP